MEAARKGAERARVAGAEHGGSEHLGGSIFAYHLGLLSIVTKSCPRAKIRDHHTGSGKTLLVTVPHKSDCTSLVFFSTNNPC